MILPITTSLSRNILLFIPYSPLTQLYYTCSKSLELVPRAPSLLTTTYERTAWMRAAGAGWECTMWRREGRGLWCAIVVSCGHGNVGDALCSHVIPACHWKSKTTRHGLRSRGCSWPRYTTPQTRRGAPCILDEPGVGVCLDCGQSAPYQNFGHDPKIGLCLDGCHFFGMPMNSSQL